MGCKSAGHAKTDDAAAATLESMLERCGDLAFRIAADDDDAGSRRNEGFECEPNQRNNEAVWALYIEIRCWIGGGDGSGGCSDGVKAIAGFPQPESPRLVCPG